MMRHEEVERNLQICVLLSLGDLTIIVVVYAMSVEIM